MKQMCCQIGVTDQTCYKRRRELGALKTNQAKQSKELLAEWSLDDQILQDVAAGDS